MRTAKRSIDLLVSVPVLLSTLPLQAVIAAAIRVTMGKPILFRQARPGLDAKPFELVKFRTMHHTDLAAGRTDDASRLTPLGTLLRSTSLDELPTLWNVIRGDLSLVGPRPLLMKYLPLYSAEQARRHEVRPGLTGLAQVAGRNSLTWEEKLRLDVEYVDTATPLLDLKILVRTVSLVIRREGVRADGAATMPEFIGTPTGDDER